MNTKHTPTPWKARDYANNEGGYWIDCVAHERQRLLGGTLATCHSSGVGAGSAQANAELIVRAVNAHKDLLAALEETLADQETLSPTVRNEAVLERIRAALAKAKGEPIDQRIHGGC